MNKQGKDGIEWTDVSWNPVTGCYHECRKKYCYAYKIANRFGGQMLNGNGDKIHDLLRPRTRSVDCGFDALGYPVVKDYKIAFPFGFEPTFHRYRLDEPAKLKKPSKIFVVSMGDLFGEWVPDEWIQEVFKACEEAPQHTYMFLTKNYLKASNYKFRDNWWIGKTITSEENADLCHGDPWNIDGIHRANQFLSIEPIQGAIPDLPYYAHEYGFKWVIVGEETGNRKEKVITKREWIVKIIEDCRFRRVPVFIKSPLYDQFPIQEWPEGLKGEVK